MAGSSEWTCKETDDDAGCCSILGRLECQCLVLRLEAAILAALGDDANGWGRSSALGDALKVAAGLKANTPTPEMSSKDTANAVAFGDRGCHGLRRKFDDTSGVEGSMMVRCSTCALRKDRCAHSKKVSVSRRTQRRIVQQGE